MPISNIPFFSYDQVDFKNKNRIIMPYGLRLEKNTFNEYCTLGKSKKLVNIKEIY